MTITILFDLGPSLLTLGDRLMATLADFTAKIDALKTQADAILAKIKDLEAKIAAGGMTEAEEAQALAQIDDAKSHLDAAFNA